MGSSSKIATPSKGTKRTRADSESTLTDDNPSAGQDQTNGTLAVSNTALHQAVMANDGSRHSLKYGAEVFLSVETTLGFVPRGLESLINEDFAWGKVAGETGLKYGQLFVPEDAKDDVPLFIPTAILIPGTLGRVGVSLDRATMDNSGFDKHLMYRAMIHIDEHTKKVLRDLYEASPVGQRNLPSGKVSGWPSDNLWLRVDTLALAGAKNWSSTEDPFPRLGNVEHCVVDSHGKCDVGPATHTDFLPNCPVIAAVNLSSWANEKGVGGEKDGNGKVIGGYYAGWGLELAALMRCGPPPITVFTSLTDLVQSPKKKRKISNFLA